MSMNLKPSLCCVCSRMSYLRCIDCDIIYCSGACKLQDWTRHDEIKALKDVEISEEAEKQMMEELENEMRLINDYLQKEELEKANDEKSFETPVKKKKDSKPAEQKETPIKTKEPRPEDEFTFFYETPTKKTKESEVVQAPIKAMAENEETPKVTETADNPNAAPPKQPSIEVKKRIQKIFDAIDKSPADFYGRIIKGNPNSLTYKLMEPYFPEHVKKGLKVSVQGRLSAAKDRISSDGSTSNSSTSPPCSDVPYINLQH